MESEAQFEIAKLRTVTFDGSNGRATAPSPRKKLAALQRLAFQLLLELQAISEVQTVNLEGGVDFYEEVSRFEIDLIKAALQMTRGHQTRAARLLNLNPTTLNSKIKHYNIPLDESFRGSIPIEISKIETRVQV